jgi:hypothetical protein
VGKSLTAIVLGAVVAAVAMWSIKNTRRLTAVGVRVQARVVDREVRHEEHRNDDGSLESRTRIYPIVEFTTADGSTYRTSVHEGLPPQQIHERALIPVIYDPQNPRNLRMDTEQGGKTGMGYLGVLVGAGIFVYGIYSLIA